MTCELDGMIGWRDVRGRYRMHSCSWPLWSRHADCSLWWLVETGQEDVHSTNNSPVTSQNFWMTSRHRKRKVNPPILVYIVLVEVL